MSERVFDLWVVNAEGVTTHIYRDKSMDFVERSVVHNMPEGHVGIQRPLDRMHIGETFRQSFTSKVDGTRKSVYYKRTQ